MDLQVELRVLSGRSGQEEAGLQNHPKLLVHVAEVIQIDRGGRRERAFSEAS